MNKLSDIDVGYIAGMIDGEGSVSLQKNPVRNRTNTLRHPVVSIWNADVQMLKYIQQVTGIGKVSKPTMYSKNYLPSYYFWVESTKAIKLLEVITPHLKTYKKRRAEMILKDYERLTPKNGKYTPKLLQEKEQFVNEFFKLTLRADRLKVLGLPNL